jgi:hypothetical protein
MIDAVEWTLSECIANPTVDEVGASRSTFVKYIVYQVFLA